MTETEDLPHNVSWEIARIKQYPAVVEGSVECVAGANGRQLICFNFRTDELLDGVSAAPICDIEPIVFSYFGSDLVGRYAPIVLSGRETFPRDLPHLNPTSDAEPASLCLARAGTQAMYDAHGVTAILKRLSDWLADAKTETLYEDGWDPVPMTSMDECVLGYIDTKVLQEQAEANPEGGYGFLCAPIVHGDKNSVFVQCATPLLDTSNEEQRLAALSRMQEFNEMGQPWHTAIPAVFCWPPRTEIESAPRFNRWNSIDVLKSGLADTQLWDSADEAVLKFDILFKGRGGDQSAPDSDKSGKRAFLLIVGLWRPAPLDPTIVGLSTDESARALELRGFYLERPPHDQDRWSGSTTVRNFLGLTPATPQIMEAVSGEESMPTFALLGAGALGSGVLDYAVRGGASAMTVIDKDLLLPHNLARHRADRLGVRSSKSEVAAELAKARVQDVEVTAVESDVARMTDDEFSEAISGCEVIVDATADPQVRRMLSKTKPHNLPVMRTEIFHQGRLGVSLITKTGHSATLNFLFQFLISEAASRNELVQSWVRYESSRDFLQEELLLGFGCRSLTTRLPAYKVDAHCSASFSLLKKALTEPFKPLIAMHALDDDGLSLGSHLIEVPPVEVFKDQDGLNGWCVKVSDHVLAKIHSQRMDKAPNETGGYLYGSIDDIAMEICVVAASPEPPGTDASPTGIRLSRSGQTPYEKAFLRRTSNRLPPIGTWHSHPAGGPAASAVDMATINTFKEQDSRRALPTIMAITGIDSDRFYVVEAGDRA